LARLFGGKGGGTWWILDKFQEILLQLLPFAPLASGFRNLPSSKKL